MEKYCKYCMKIKIVDEDGYCCGCGKPLHIAESPQPRNAKDGQEGASNLQ